METEKIVRLIELKTRISILADYIRKENDRNYLDRGMVELILFGQEVDDDNNAV